MIKVLHVTPGLESGGAEMMLAKLAAGMDRLRFENIVVSLTDDGPVLGAVIRKQSIALQTLKFPRGVPNPMLLWKLAGHIRREKPDVVHTWMYHANVVGSLANNLAGRVPLVWGIHNAKLNPASMKKQTLRTISLNKHMSYRFPDAITCSSESALAVHTELGYAASKMQVVLNGIDADEFVPDAQARSSVRNELGIDQNAPVVGMVARYTKQKDHATFFRAAALLHVRRPDVRFVLCGMDVTPENPALSTMVSDANLGTSAILLGVYPSSTARLTASFDVATSSSSYGESFCIALGEAMSCGIPCVTTNMEGPAALVGDVGRVVPIGDAAALAAGWEHMLSLSPAERAVLSERSRRRILEGFSLDAMVRRYEDLYLDSQGIGRFK